MTDIYDDNNIFAKILRDELPCIRVYEDENVLAFMDVMPQGRGHLLVVPHSPSRHLLDAQADVLATTIKAVQKLAVAVKKALSADGITIMQFNEEAGGQSVFHLHFHVIARFTGIDLKHHTGEMADRAELEAIASQIRAML